MDSVVFITGASTGFGRAAAETLGRPGYTVFATMRNCSGTNATHSAALQALADKERWRLQVLDLDVANDDSVDRAVEAALEQAGRIDVVINNAGTGALGLTEAYTTERFKRLFEMNLFGAAPAVRARKRKCSRR